MGTSRYVAHLTGRGFSGRLVKYRVLDIAEVQHVEEQVAREITKDTTVLQYNQKVNELGRSLMLVAVSEPMTPEQYAAAAPASISWRPLDPGTLSIEWGKFFTTKDTMLLRAIYDREHSVTEKELDAIMSGKAEVLEV